MKAHSKAIISHQAGYIDLSEQLRAELECKIENLYAQDKFDHYANTPASRFEPVKKNDLMCACLLKKVPKEHVLSGKLLQGVKTWFHMYYDDRLSVIYKFRLCYSHVVMAGRLNDAPAVFCRFLISELLGILAERRWQALIDLKYPEYLN